MALPAARSVACGFSAATVVADVGEVAGAGGRCSPQPISVKTNAMPKMLFFID